MLSMNDNQSYMMNLNRNYGAALWGNLGNLVAPPPPTAAVADPMNFVKANYPPKRGNWKGKRGKKGVMVGGGGNGGGGGGVAAKRFYPKKKFNNRFAPYAPRNTSSFIIRAKKSGGIASFVSPYPATPAVLPTPVFSPSNEVLGDIAKEEWGVNGYGSMNGLIRLRSPGNEVDEEEEAGGDPSSGGSSESDVEEHVEVERRLDHDLSRFEMIYPNGEDNGNGMIFESEMEEQDVQVMQLEEENLTLRERLFLVERELMELKTRLQCLEANSQTNKIDKEKNKNGVALMHKTDSNNEENHDEPEPDTDNRNENNREDEMNGALENEGGGDVCSEKSLCDSD